MDELDEKVLNIQQRQKRAQELRRNEPKIEIARERAKKKVAPEANIKKRAYAMARQLIRSRLTNVSQAEYAKMGPSEKMTIDRIIEKKGKAIKKLALRLIPKVKKAEYARLQSYMHGQAMANHGAPEGNHVSEELNNLFVEYFGDSAPGNSGSTGERSDNPITSSGRKTTPKQNGKTETAGNAKGGSKTKGSPIVQYGKFGEDLEVESSEFKGLVKKADKSGIDLEILGEVYNRGLDAWVEGYNVTPTQYAFARVNSYINQGRTYFNEDADLHEAMTSWSGKGLLGKMRAANKAFKRGAAGWEKGMHDVSTVKASTKTLSPEQKKATLNAKAGKGSPLELQQKLIKRDLRKEEVDLEEKRGLWDNIHAKQKRIKAGSGEHMRKPGSKGAPSEADLKAAQESVEESKNTPYVKPHIEKDSTRQSAWKASNKHGHVKYFGLPFKKAAERHAGLSEEVSIDEHIVKVKSGYRLVSKSSGKNLGTYPTKEGAEKRERQVQYFKHQNEEVELDEVLSSTFKKTEKFGGKDLGRHISTIEGAKHIGTLENGHHVYHSYDPKDKMHDYHVVDPKTKRINIHLTTKQQKAPGAEEVSVLTANNRSLGAHHLYQHLVTKHNKIISSNDQSPGARKVWANVGKHRGINIHGYDPISRTTFHMKPTDDEEYTDRDNKEVNTIKADRKLTAPRSKDRAAHDAELEDLDKKKYTYIVMHKKGGLKEDTDCSCNNPKGVARGETPRKKTQNVERDLTPNTPSNDAAHPKNPASDAFKQQQIKKKIIDELNLSDQELDFFLEHGVEFTELLDEAVNPTKRQTKKLISRWHDKEQGQMYGDQPYSYHPKKVMNIGKKVFGSTRFGPVTKKVALLHDVLEDTPKTPEELRAKGFTPEVINAVKLLSKDKKLSYKENIERIINSGNRHAQMVKYADNMANYTGDKSGWDPEKRKASQAKYMDSMKRLGAVLGVNHHEKLEEGSVKPSDRLIGTDSLVKTYKKATPGQNLDEAFNIAFAAGIGQTYTAADLGMKMQGGFALHPSVLDEIEEDVVSGDKAPVVVPAHKDAYGNVIPAKTVMRKSNRKIIKSGNVHNGDTDQPIGEP